MKFFDKLERRFGKYAIPNLMYYIIGIYLVGFVIELFAPDVYTYYFSLDAAKVLHGQVWRLVTFILQPPSSSIIFMVFTLYFYYVIGTVLERIWGSFKFNVYYFSGIILHIIAAFVIYFIFGWSFNMSTYYINLALFLAFAVEQADAEVLLFFVLPIKMKWLGWLDGIIFAITIIGGYLTPVMPKAIWRGFYNAGLLAGNSYTCYVMATCALISMLNFIIFFFATRKAPGRTYTQKNYRKAEKRADKARKNAGSFNERFYNANSEKSTWDSANKPYINPRGTKHRCAVCNRTELDGDNLTFRFCTKCAGNLEYCQDHLYTHIHVTGDNNNQNTQKN